MTVAAKSSPVAIAAAEPVDIDVVFLGVRENSSEKIDGYFAAREALAEITNVAAADRAASAFGLKDRDLPAVIGGIYKVKGILDESLKLIRMIPTFEFTGNQTMNNSLIAAFEARDKAARIAQRARKLEADLSKRTKIARALEPLRVDYFKTDTIGRLAFEVAVLAELRKGRS